MKLSIARLILSPSHPVVISAYGISLLVPVRSLLLGAYSSGLAPPPVSMRVSSRAGGPVDPQKLPDHRPAHRRWLL